MCPNMVGLRVQEETEAGKDLGTALAVAAALTDSMLSLRCAACFGALGSGGSMVYSCFGPCEGKVSYCCVACYNSDADLHAQSAECHLLMLSSSSSCDLRTALRFLACTGNGTGVDDRNRIQGLLSNRSNILSDREAAANVKEASHVMQLARRSAGLEWPYQDKEQEILILQHAFCVVVTNGVQIEVHEDSPPSRLLLGTGVYRPGFSWLNHSCRPNACYRFVMHSDDQPVEPCLDWLYKPSPRHPRVVVRSIQVIQAGGEVTISYTDLLKPKRARQAELQQKYKFNCACERCRNFPWSYSDMTLESIGKCGNGSCFGWLSLDTKACSWCSRVDSSSKDVVLEIKLAEARDKAMNAFLFDDDPGFCRLLLESVLCDVLVHSWPPTSMRSTCLEAFSILKSAYKVLAATEGDDSSRYVGAAAGLSLMISASVQHLYNMGEPGLVIVLGLLWLETGEAFLRWNQSKIDVRDETQKELSVHMIQLVSSELELGVNKPPQAEWCDPRSFAGFCLQLSRHMLNLSLGELHPVTQYVQSEIEQERSYFS